MGETVVGNITFKNNANYISMMTGKDIYKLGAVESTALLWKQIEALKIRVENLEKIRSNLENEYHHPHL